MKRSAGDILSAQLEHDVLEAKAALTQELGWPLETVDAFENLIGKVVTRWWVERALRHHGELSLEDQLAERRQGRLQIMAQTVSMIQARVGAMDPLTAQITTLSNQAETQALWRALMEAGLVTESIRQDYLDEAVLNLQQKAAAHASKIHLASGNGSVRAS